MEEVNRLLQFSFIIETLTKISNGLRTCGVYDRVTISKDICLKDKRRRPLLPRLNHKLKSLARWNTYMKIRKLPLG